MTLHPCSTCSRHIRAHEVVCPFCGAPSVSLVSRVVQLAGRVSRAAVFASAAACTTGRPAAQAPPPPHDHAPPADAATQPAEGAPGPPEGGRFAQPPAAGRATVRGVVRQAGRALANVTVELYRPTPHWGSTTTTNQRGEYMFSNLEPGSYQLTPDVHTGGRFGPPRLNVELEAGDDKRADLDVPAPPPVDRGPCCKPYGAPPARRRVV